MPLSHAVITARTINKLVFTCSWVCLIQKAEDQSGRYRAPKRDSWVASATRIV